MAYFPEISLIGFISSLGFWFLALHTTKVHPINDLDMFLGNGNVLGHISMVYHISVNKIVIKQGSKFTT